MAKVIIHPLFEQKLHEYVEEAYEVYGRKTARRWMTEIDKIKSLLIYYYLEKMDEVHFVDIWDMRKNPSSFWKQEE